MFCKDLIAGRYSIIPGVSDCSTSEAARLTPVCVGGHHSLSRRGAEVFVADKLFISTRRDGALNISILLHVYIEQLLK